MTTVYQNFRELLSENVEKPMDFTTIDEKNQNGLISILEEYGDAVLVDIYLEYFGELPPMRYNYNNWSICAIQYGKMEMLNRLYYYGIDLDKINGIETHWGDLQIPLEYALGNEEIFDYLLEMGAEPRIYSFGGLACHSDKIVKSNLKKVWDLDPSSYEPDLPEAFERRDLEACNWLKEIGAMFSFRTILFYACRNLWTEFVIDLISNMNSFKPEDLNTIARYQYESPIEAAFNQKEQYSGLACEFINTLLLHYTDQIEEAMKIPIVCISGKCEFSKCTLSISTDNSVYKLPCGHLSHESCLTKENSSCPVCDKFKYKLKSKSCFTHCFSN